MKKSNSRKSAGVAFAALFAFGVGLSPSAKAVLFQNLAPDQYVFKFADFDTGSLYTTQPLNGTVGTTTPSTGAPLLDAATASQASNAHAIAPFGNNLEDSWGVAFVTQIFKISDPVTPVWSSVGDSQQLTVIFYGEQDFFLKQTASATQTIDGVNLHADFYLQNNSDVAPPFTSFDASGGPAARPADLPGFTLANDGSYPTVTDGTLVLSTVSTAGFINDVGQLGGTATEFESAFTGSALNGSGLGTTFLSVTGGTLGAKYNNNQFASPYIAGNTADFQAQFTTTTVGAGSWLVSSNDPVRTQVIPEPTTVLAGLACMLPLLGAGLRRGKKLFNS